MQIALLFFLWDAVFRDPEREIFGYDRAKILTYVFGILIVKSFVLATRARDVAGEIGRGDLTNYLLKPVNYFYYWLSRDLSSKVLNLGFAFGEMLVLYLLLRPPFFVQTNFLYLVGFGVAVALAILLFFVIVFMVNFVPFWFPELAWGAQFMVIVVLVDFLSGGFFPLDILPQNLQGALDYTPFPYLVFFPLQIYLGKISSGVMFKGMLIAAGWLVILWWTMKKIWKKGLRVYGAYGR